MEAHGAHGGPTGLRPQLAVSLLRVSHLETYSVIHLESFLLGYSLDTGSPRE